jgi:hypothetical protein
MGVGGVLAWHHATAVDRSEPARDTVAVDDGTWLEHVQYVCDSGQLGDDGYTLTIDGLSETAVSAGPGQSDLVDIGCLLGRLGTSDVVLGLIENTRALDGMQTGSWKSDQGTFSAWWNYHPDDGLEMVIHQN